MIKRILPYLVIFLCVIASINAARAQNFSDVEIKAAYIFKLSKFVTWNGRQLNHINFCYIESSNQNDDASVGSSFTRLVRDKNAGDQWNIKRLRGSEGIENCNMVFIADTEEGSLSTILSRTRGKDILTISDARRFIFKEGMLGFVLDDQDRVKMEANLSTIRKTNVMVGAAVLELMQQVIK